MKTILILFSFLLASQFTYPQSTQYQTYSSVMILSGTKDGQTYQWENKNIAVRLDYQVGNFIVRLYNTDFQYKDEQNVADPDSLQNRTEYQLTGIFPINELINQMSINQTYDVELQLTNDMMMLNETLNFSMEVTRPGQGSANYRVFMLSGILYNDQVNLPALEGFDNEIEIKLAFNGFANQQ